MVPKVLRDPEMIIKMAVGSDESWIRPAEDKQPRAKCSILLKKVLLLRAVL